MMFSETQKLWSFTFLFQAPMVGFAKKTPKVQMGVRPCVAIGDSKQFKPRSRNGANVNSIGVAMLSVKPA